MTSRQARFITACQTFLVLGVVLAVLAPAANVLSLDVVSQTPVPGASSGSTGTAADRPEADSQEADSPATDPQQRSRVASAPTDAAVTEYAFDASAADVPDGTDAPRKNAEEGAGTAEGDRVVETPAEKKATGDGRTEVTAQPAEVNGFGTVGVTWDPAAELDEQAIEVQVRTEKDGVWGDWQALEYHDEHGPDPDSAEAEGALRPGTEPLVVGEVDRVQARTLTDGAPPADLQLAVVEPTEGETAVQSPAIDTADLPAADAGTSSDPGTDPGTDTGSESSQEPGLELQASSLSAPKPVIYSRAQWGANEKIRDKSSLRYGSISAGFVHHTVNGNDYDRDDVPGILRSIYSYHVKSRGWSDVGYNFLVDKFGRIWEGRYGGVGKAVVGAHTLGYNDYAFAMSAIGNFDIAQPSQAMVDAYGSLFAWKLAKAGVKADSTRQKVGRGTFQAINGHRDAGSTACPGRYLYAKLGEIRKRAAKIQTGQVTPPTGPTTPTEPSEPWTGSGINTSLTARPYADLLVRRKSDGRGLVLPTGGLTDFSAPRRLGGDWSSRSHVQVVKDVTGDRRADLVFVRRDGALVVRGGNGSGGFNAGKKVHKPMRSFIAPVAVGHVVGDGRGDFVAKKRSTGRRHLLWVNKKGKLKDRRLPKAWTGYRMVTAAGDLNLDGRDDVLVRDAAGRLGVRYGRGAGKFTTPRAVSGDFSAATTVVGGGDFTLDGRPDLLVRRSDGSTWVYPSVGGTSFGRPYGPTRTSLAWAGALSSAGNVVGGAGADVVARNGSGVSLYSHAGTYELGSVIDTGRNLAPADVLVNVGDWNGDGVGDVIGRVRENQNLVLYPGKGGGKLGARVKIGSNWKGYHSFAAVGDVTGDRLPDMVASDPWGGTWLYPSDGKGGFKPRMKAPSKAIMRLPVSTSGYDWRVGIKSMSGATNADVVVRERGTGLLYVLDGSAGYKVRRFLGSGMDSYDLVG